MANQRVMHTRRAPRPFALTAGWLSLAVGLLLALPNTGRSQDRRFAIASIEAKLFYSNSGRLSANILGNPNIVLYNTPMGEGRVEGPSENTLIVVRLQGPPKGDIEAPRLHITATTEADTLADQVIEVGPMNTAGNFYAPCWLEDTGCEPVEVTVELVNGKERQQRRVTIPFQCSD